MLLISRKQERGKKLLSTGHKALETGTNEPGNKQIKKPKTLGFCLKKPTSLLGRCPQFFGMRVFYSPLFSWQLNKPLLTFPQNLALVNWHHVQKLNFH
jgi:hypothetical protein